MPDFRLVTFSNPNELVEACATFDDSFMNFPFGSLLDSLDASNRHVSQIDPSDRTLLAIYEANDLM
jgi:hypothetical protein